MTKKTRIFVLATFLLCSMVLFQSSCNKNKDDNTPPDDNPKEEKIAENAIIIDDFNAQLLSDSIQIEAGTYTYLFTGDMPKFSTGDIIVGQTGEGYLRKVTAANVDGSNVTLETEQATLEELFENTSLSVNIPVEQTNKNSEKSISVTEEIYKAKGVSVVDGEGINLSISNVEFKFGNSEESLKLKITEGSVNIVPNLKYDHVIEYWEIKRVALTSLGTEFNFENKISISGEINGIEKVEQIPLFKAKTRMLIGYLVITVVHDVYIKIEPSVSVGFDFNYNSNTNYIYDIGAIYENGSFNSFAEKTWENHTVVNNSLSIQVGGQIKISLVYKPTLFIYAIKGPYLENSGFAEVKGAISLDNNWNLNKGFGIESKIGLDFKIFKKNVINFSKTYKWLKPNVYVAPYEIEIIGGDNQTGELGEQLPEPLQIKVTDNIDKPLSNVNVYFNVTRGGGTVDSASVITDENGFAEVQWTLGNEEGNQNVEATVKKANDSQISSPVIFDVASNTSNIIMTIRVTNLLGECDDCDTPGISWNPEGAGNVILGFGSSLEFQISESSPYLYLWTCNPGCNWTAYPTPVIIGESIDTDELNPFHRKLRFTRID